MNLPDDKLRQLIFNDLERVKELLLTKNDIEIINYIKDKRGVTAVDIAKRQDISMQNASTKLKRLFDQGYLIRREMSSSSGGIEFVYWDSFAH